MRTVILMLVGISACAVGLQRKPTVDTANEEPSFSAFCVLNQPAKPTGLERTNGCWEMDADNTIRYYYKDITPKDAMDAVDTLK